MFQETNEGQLSPVTEKTGVETVGVSKFPLVVLQVEHPRLPQEVIPEGTV